MLQRLQFNYSNILQHAATLCCRTLQDVAVCCWCVASPELQLDGLVMASCTSVKTAIAAVVRVFCGGGPLFLYAVVRYSSLR